MKNKKGCRYYRQRQRYIWWEVPIDKTHIFEVKKINSLNIRKQWSGSIKHIPFKL